MKDIMRLGYLDLQVTDPEKWVAFMRTIFALDPDAGDVDTLVEYRLDKGRQRLTFRRSERDGIERIGWEARDGRALQHLADHLEQAGVAVESADRTTCLQRGVNALLRLHGPDGEALDIYAPGPRAALPHSTALELGHVVLASGDRDASVAWYRKMLGFMVSDHIFWDDGVEASFLRCGPRHHSIALTNLIGDMQPGELGHFMLEAGSMDEVGRAHDAALQADIPLAFTLGRHSNDHAFSFYAYTPSSWLVEYAAGGRTIDDPETATETYDAPSIWGHKHQAPPGSDPAKMRY